MIQVSNLRKQFGDTEILKGISFDVPDKSILGIINARTTATASPIRANISREARHDTIVRSIAVSGGNAAFPRSPVKL